MSKNKQKFTVGIYHVPKSLERKSPVTCIFFRTDGVSAEGYWFEGEKWAPYWSFTDFEKSI